MYRADDKLPYIFKRLGTTNRENQPALIERAAADSLDVKDCGVPLRRSVRQSLFLKNELFGRIEHPAAENTVRGQDMVLPQLPLRAVITERKVRRVNRVCASLPPLAMVPLARNEGFQTEPIFEKE